MSVEYLSAELFLHEVERVVAFKSRSRCRQWTCCDGGLLWGNRGRRALFTLG